MTTDFPLAEIIPVTDKLIQSGCTIFFKWTCAGCGVRQTFDTPIRFTCAASARSAAT